MIGRLLLPFVGDRERENRCVHYCHQSIYVVGMQRRQSKLGTFVHYTASSLCCWDTKEAKLGGS